MGSTPNLGTVLTLNLTIMKLWVAREIAGWLGLYKTKPIYKNDQYGGNWAGCFMGYVDEDLNVNKTTLPEVTHANSPQEVELKLTETNVLDLFKKLPHLDDNRKVVEDWGYTPCLYHFDSEWHVSWTHCDENDTIEDFCASTPEKAIKDAFEWCVVNNLINE